jgi:hypothetical protein
MKIELSHDFLAQKIYEEASIEDKTRAKATKFLHDRYQYYLTSNDLLLTEREVIYVTPYLEGMDLSQAEIDYVDYSKAVIKSLKFRARLKDAALVALVCVVVLGSWAYWEHSRFQDTSRKLAEAKDTISLLRNMENPIYSEDAIEITANSFSTSSALHPNNGSAKLSYTSIKLIGIIRNEKEEPIPSAIVRVLGAEVLSLKDGSFELSLILSPQDLPKDLELQISKVHYQDKAQSIDIDKATINFDLVLVRE